MQLPIIVRHSNLGAISCFVSSEVLLVFCS